MVLSSTLPMGGVWSSQDPAGPGGASGKDWDGTRVWQQWGAVTTPIWGQGSSRPVGLGGAGLGSLCMISLSPMGSPWLGWEEGLPGRWV